MTQTDDEGEEEDEEDEEAVTNRPDPNLKDASEALAVFNRVFKALYIWECIVERITKLDCALDYVKLHAAKQSKVLIAVLWTTKQPIVDFTLIFAFNFVI